MNKILTKPDTEDILAFLQEKLAGLPDFTEESVKPIFQEGMEKFSVKMGGMIQPLRVALTGTNVSPGIYEVLEILGSERVLQRIERTREMLKQRS